MIAAAEDTESVMFLMILSAEYTVYVKELVIYDMIRCRDVARGGVSAFCRFFFRIAKVMKGYQGCCRLL